MKAIILGGGSGSRLWPLSREMYPKQLLSIDSNKSLLQSTYERLLNLTHCKDIVTITNLKHTQDVKKQLDEISKDSVVLSEPLSKNTAPAVAVSLLYLLRENEDEFVVILPSDHLIKDINAFCETIENAKILANRGYIVTLGVKPTYPETGYGYIKVSENKLCEKGWKVEKFTEKPDLDTAIEYISSRDSYFWNSGIFVSKISVLLKEFKDNAPEIYNKVVDISFENSLQIKYSVYECLPSISIDYAIIEKSKKIAVVELLSDWSDLGSWKSLYQVKEKDQNGNVIFGNVVTNNVRNSLIYSQKNLIAVSGLENIVMVDTEDATLACNIDDSQNVKKLYELLKEKSSDTVVLHKTIFRPWGYYTSLDKGKNYLTRLLCIQPLQNISLQSHKFRSEHWVILEGIAEIEKDGIKYKLLSGDSIDIPICSKHSLKNLGSTELKVIEVQTGNFLSESDVTRYN